MKGIKLESILGQNDSQLQFKEISEIENIYLQNNKRIPEQKFENKLIEQNIQKLILKITKLAKITPHPKRISEIIDRETNYETDYLYLLNQQGKERDIYTTIPLIGVRLSNEHNIKTALAIANYLQENKLNKNESLYILKNNLFIESDRILITQQPFLTLFNYSNEIISKIEKEI